MLRFQKSDFLTFCYVLRKMRGILRHASTTKRMNDLNMTELKVTQIIIDAKEKDGRSMMRAALWVYLASRAMAVGSAPMYKHDTCVLCR
jgi:hypothetical protein